MRKKSYILRRSPDPVKSPDGIDNKGFQSENVTNFNGELSASVIPTGDPNCGQNNPAKTGNNETDENYCGIGPCRPRFMQGCRSMACFSASYSLIGLVTSALNSYINSQITTLEKHFNLSSSMSGFIMSCNDLGYLTTTLFISHYTRRTHIPRALAAFTFLYAISGLLCTTAFFATRGQLPTPPRDGDQSFRVDFTQTCQNMTTNNSICEDTSKLSSGSFQISSDWRVFAISVIAFGMILQGIAKSPRQAYLGTYVDDNVPKTKTTVYLGVMTGLSIFGPAFAYTLGGVFNNMYITLEETNMSPRDPRWLGAWWLGFIVFGGSGLVVGIPLIFFPKHMRKQDISKSGKKASGPDNKTFDRVCHEVKGLLKSILHLFLNPVYVCLIFASGINMMAVSGIMSFLSKYIETQFTLTASRANIMLGAMNIFAASVGTIVGGYLTSRFKLSPMACLKLMIGCKLLSAAISCTGFFLGCDQPVINTGTTFHRFSSETPSISQCVQNCYCDDHNYFPICGADKKSYFSPCHAGCLFMDGKTFTNCSCLATNRTQEAVSGLCEQDCNTLYFYLLSSLLGAFTSTLIIMPNFVATVRSVKEEDKPLAIGFNAFIGTLIGWFPGPVIFGALVDTTCILWKSTCASVGACSLYDIRLFRLRFHALMIGLRIITVTFYIMAFIFSVCSKKKIFEANKDNMSVFISAKDEEITSVDPGNKDTLNIQTSAPNGGENV